MVVKPVRYVLVSSEDNETIIDTFIHTGEFPMEIMFPPGLRWVPCPHTKVVHGWKYIHGRFVPPEEEVSTNE